MRRAERTKVVGRDSLDVMAKSRPVLVAALGALLARQEYLGPFLIVEDNGPEGLAADGCARRFVQYCGSKDKPLRFEAPAVGIAEEHDRDDLEASVTRALSVLYSLCLSGVPFEHGVTILEEDTFDASAILSGAYERKRRRAS